MPALRGFARYWSLPVVVGLVFTRVGYPSLFDPDEAHYAQLTREMVAAGNWLVPLLDGTPYIDKPALFHWLQAAAITMFGASEWAARLPSALAALMLLAVTRVLGARLFGAPTGDRAALMLATSPMAFALARIGLLDMVYSAFLFGFVACMLIAMRERSTRAEWTGYLLLALAVMTKGPMALVLAGLLCAIAWALGGESRAQIERLRWKRGIACAALLASPWFLYMFVRFGDAFVNGYLIAGNLYYVTQPPVFSSRAVSHTFYVRAFTLGLFPWSIFALARAADILVSRRADRSDADPSEKLHWLWGILVIGFFSVARFKLDHYIFPAAPAVCLIAAHTWTRAAAETAKYPVTRWAVIGLGACLIVAGSFGVVYLWDVDLGLPRSAISLPIVLSLGGVALLASLASANWRVPKSPSAPIAMLVAVYAVVIGAGLPFLERTRPTAVVGKALNERSTPDAPMAIYRIEQWRASLRYYTGRPLVRLSTPEDVADFVRNSTQPVYIVTTRPEYRLLRAAPAPREVFQRPSVVGTSRLRLGLRRQRWEDLVVLTNAPLRGGWRP